MLSAIVEYKKTPALTTIALFMYGDERRWYDAAEGINAHASPRRKLAATMRYCADELLITDGDWSGVDDMVNSTLNNVRHDVGEAMGDAMMFFGESNR